MNTSDLRAEIEGKIRNLLSEFGEGKISSEQFNIIYERYTHQLAMAEQMASGELEGPEAELSTLAIREITSGKAIGVGIYHHRSGRMIEMIGEFDLTPDIISPTLNEFSDMIDNNQFIEPRTIKVDRAKSIWVVFMARRYTTAITIFRNQPSPIQIREMERLLHDFEEANRRFLDMVDVSGQLARPFLVFVKQKLH